MLFSGKVRPPTHDPEAITAAALEGLLLIEDWNLALALEWGASLDTAFPSGQALLDARVQARGRLRNAVHVNAHLETRDLLLHGGALGSDRPA